MKKLAIIAIISLTSLMICWAQDLSVIKDDKNYLLVKTEKSSRVRVDSAQLQILTITTVENKKIVIDTIKSSDYSNVQSLETMIIRNYDELKINKSIVIDSANNVYSLKKIWQKERIKKTFTISRHRNVITVRVDNQKHSIWPNLEYPLITILTIYLLYVILNKKKDEKQTDLIMIIGIAIITAIAWPSNSISGNLFSIIMMPLAFNLIIFNALRHIHMTRDLATFLAMSLFAAYICHSFDFLWLTAGLSFLAILIIWAIKNKKKKVKIIIK